METESIDLQSIGQRIRAERERLGYTQWGLCMRVLMAPSALSSIETGRRSVGIEVGTRIAREFGWSLDRLFTGKDHQ